MLTAAAAAKSLQLCPTLCDPIDSSPPGSPIPGILQLLSPKKYCSTKWAAQSKWTHEQAGMKGQGWCHPPPMASLCSCLPSAHTVTAPTTFLSSVLPLYIETFLRVIFHHLTNKKQNPSVSQSRSSTWSQVNAERLILNLFIHKHKETLFPFVIMPRCDHKSGQAGKAGTSFFWDKFWSHFCEKS